MTMKTVSFYSEGHVIVANLFVPNDAAPGQKYPAVVICQGLTGIRNTPLMNATGEALNDAGYVAIAFDYRGWGDSGGERGRMAPLEQVDDIRNTVTYLETLDYVDPDRIGAFGVSYGCLTAPHAAAVDSRIKAVLGAVGVATGSRAIQSTRTPEDMADWEWKVAEARRRRVIFNEVDRCVRCMDILLDDQSAKGLWAMWESTPAWRNPMGFDSIGRILDHRPIDLVHRIAPRALGLICAADDTCADPSSLREMFDAAQEPKRWVEVAGMGHFDLYVGEGFTRFKKEILGFFNDHLKTSQASTEAVPGTMLS